MALEYPGAATQFVENALVFAPGKTIIESLRELSRIPYERLLPPRLLKAFLASFKLTFTRDGDPDIPVIRGSSFNLSSPTPRRSGSRPECAESFYRFVDPASGRRYQLSDATAPGGSGKGNPHYEFLGVTRYWRFSRDRMQHLYEQGRIVQTGPGTVPREKRYLDEMPGVPIQSIWEDVKPIQSQAAERRDYPTQKPTSLVERVLQLWSNPGDVVLDCFVGSGTTAVVAQRLGRRWIGCDINKGAIQTTATAKRLIEIIDAQAAETAGKLDLDDAATRPAQLSFATYRVNDYDLAIQHNEAVNLACEHLGVVRTRSDSFFDGTLGPRLVKIVPFDHPITPVDLGEVARELRNRPGEDRDVTVVGLAASSPAIPGSPTTIGRARRTRSRRSICGRILGTGSSSPISPPRRP